MWSWNVRIRTWQFLGVLMSIVLLGACKRQMSSVASAETAAPAPPAAPSCLETNVRAEAGAKCMACLDAHAINKGKDGCCAIHDEIGRRLCDAAAACMRKGRISTGAKCNVAGDTSTCYCGTHQVNCWLPGVANGPCMAEITAAAARNIETQTTDSPNEDTILNRYGDVKFALGPATNIASIAGAFCSAECELTQ